MNLNELNGLKKTFTKYPLESKIKIKNLFNPCNLCSIFVFYPLSGSIFESINQNVFLCSLFATQFSF